MGCILIMSGFFVSNRLYRFASILKIASWVIIAECLEEIRFLMLRVETIYYSFHTCLRENNLSSHSSPLLLSVLLGFSEACNLNYRSYILLGWPKNMFRYFCTICWDVLPQPSFSILRLLSVPWRRHQKSRDLMKLLLWGWEIESVKNDEMWCQDHSTYVARASMVFPLVMYGCESWTVMTAECRKIDAFKLWRWRRLLRVLWTAKRSNQSIVNELSPGVHWKDWCWIWKSNIWPTICKVLIRCKSPWSWRYWGKDAKGITEDEMVGWP